MFCLTLPFSEVGKDDEESGTNLEFFARAASSEARSNASNRRKKISASIAASVISLWRIAVPAIAGASSHKAAGGNVT
jgi:hypothetical protein